MPDEKRPNPNSFWSQFRWYAIPVQVFVVATCGVFYWQTSDWTATLVLFLCMEIFGLAGAAWSVNMARRVQARSERLPLDPRG
jgi:hypothetical protein